MKKNTLRGLGLTLIISSITLGQLHAMDKIMQQQKLHEYLSKNDIKTVIENKATTTEEKITCIKDIILCNGDALKNKQILSIALQNSDDSKLIQFLLEQDVDPNEKNDLHHSPLTTALRCRKNSAILKLLVDHPFISIDFKDNTFVQYLLGAHLEDFEYILQKNVKNMPWRILLKNVILAYSKHSKPLLKRTFSLFEIYYNFKSMKSLQQKTLSTIEIKYIFTDTCYRMLHKYQNFPKLCKKITTLLQKFDTIIMPMLHTLITEIHSEKIYNESAVQELFMAMINLQKLIWQQQPNRDILEDPKNKNYMIPLFQNYFATTTTQPTLTEIQELTALAYHWKSSKKNYKALLALRMYAIDRTSIYCIDPTTGVSPMQNHLYQLYQAIIWQQDTHYIDIFNALFDIYPEIYELSYANLITNKKLSPNILQMAYSAVIHKLPLDENRFTIHRIQDPQFNYGIRASRLTQLHNLAPKRILLRCTETNNPEKPIAINLESCSIGSGIGRDCAKNILAFVGCSFTFDKNYKPKMLIKKDVSSDTQNKI